MMSKKIQILRFWHLRVVKQLPLDKDMSGRKKSRKWSLYDLEGQEKSIEIFGKKTEIVTYFLF